MRHSFYGMGYPHPGMECFMKHIKKLQAHYSCNSNLGLKMSASIKMMIVELEIVVQPFQESFTKYKYWINSN
jgi:hypothetical protein